MKVILGLLGIGLACLALAACGGGGGSSGSDRQQIENVFNGMFSAMQQGDYGRVCGYLSQRQQNSLVSGARQVGVTASSCSDALTSLLKKAGLTRAELARAFGLSATKRKVDSLSVHGQKATVTFTETTGGHTYRETDSLVREGGKWRADRIVKRTQTD